MVDSVRRVGAAAAYGRRATGAPPAGFSLPAPAAPEAVPMAASAVPTQPLLALQPGPDDAARDAAARRRGEALLQDLASLQRDLLAGRVSPSRMARLALLAEGEAGADPTLRETLDALSLRAKVQAALAGR